MKYIVLWKTFYFSCWCTISRSMIILSELKHKISKLRHTINWSALLAPIPIQLNIIQYVNKPTSFFIITLEAYSASSLTAGTHSLLFQNSLALIDLSHEVFGKKIQYKKYETHARSQQQANRNAAFCFLLSHFSLTITFLQSLNPFITSKAA